MASQFRKNFAGLISCLAVIVVTAGAAHAQSQTALDGMRVYNSGNFDLAFKLLSQAAKAGDAEAQVNLGYMYARGHGVTANRTEADRLYEQSAKGGSSEGMNALGYKYLYAKKPQKDPRRAAYWFCEAAVRGNPRAMNNLALMLLNGDLPVDELEARNLLEQSANLGHANAMFNLALSYANSIPRSSEKSNAWVIRAAQAGHPYAQQLLRSKGYTGPLPPPVAVGLNQMKPAPKDVIGHTKQCGLYIS